MPSYRYIGKTAYSFTLQGKTSEGRPTLHSYATLYLDSKQPGSLLLILPRRAARAASDAVNEFCTDVPAAVRTQKSYSALEVGMSRDGWSTMSKPLEQLPSRLVANCLSRMSLFGSSWPSSVVR